MKNVIVRFMKDESGATAIEYGLIAALISITIITAAASIGGKVSARFDEVDAALGS
jgi:pilus assembly protein Flp/PilA